MREITYESIVSAVRDLCIEANCALPCDLKEAIAKAEREIAKLEAKIAALDAEAEANGSDYQKLMELSAEREGLENELLELYEQWEDLNG